MLAERKSERDLSSPNSPLNEPSAIEDPMNADYRQQCKERQLTSYPIRTDAQHAIDAQKYGRHP